MKEERGAPVCIVQQGDEECLRKEKSPGCLEDLEDEPGVGLGPGHNGP